MPLCYCKSYVIQGDAQKGNPDFIAIMYKISLPANSIRSIRKKI